MKIYLNILTFLLNAFLLNSCSILSINSNKSKGRPVDGAFIIGKNDFLQGKIYPFGNLNKLEQKNENFNEVDYALLEETSNLKFEINKEVMMKYIDFYQKMIDDSLQQKPENLDAESEKTLEEFQKNLFLLKGNVTEAKILKESLNKISIPEYLDDFFKELKKYMEVKKKIERYKEEKDQEVKGEENFYWDSFYNTNTINSKDKFKEKKFNYYEYVDRNIKY